MFIWKYCCLLSLSLSSTPPALLNCFTYQVDIHRSFPVALVPYPCIIAHNVQPSKALQRLTESLWKHMAGRWEKVMTMFQIHVRYQCFKPQDCTWCAASSGAVLFQSQGDCSIFKTWPSTCSWDSGNSAVLMCWFWFLCFVVQLLKSWRNV